MGSVFYGTSMAFRLGIADVFAKYIHIHPSTKYIHTLITAIGSINRIINPARAFLFLFQVANKRSLNGSAPVMRNYYLTGLSVSGNGSVAVTGTRRPL